MIYVVIHGLAPSNLLGHSDQSDEKVREYVLGIVYGQPRAIYATLLATGKFVALVSYDDGPTAAATFGRMSSFTYGAQLISDVDIAWREFGSWIGLYSGCLNPEWERV